MKTITIRDSTYKALKQLKEPGMSFSDAIDHLLETRGDELRRRFGALSRSTALDEIEETAEETRRSATFRTL
jgi:predicted CopG family antitoxin